MVNYIIGPLIIYNNPNVEMRTILERSLRKKHCPKNTSVVQETVGKTLNVEREQKKQVLSLSKNALLG